MLIHHDNNLASLPWMLDMFPNSPHHDWQHNYTKKGADKLKCNARNPYPGLHQWRRINRNRPLKAHLAEQNQQWMHLYTYESIDPLTEISKGFKGFNTCSLVIAVLFLQKSGLMPIYSIKALFFLLFEVGCVQGSSMKNEFHLGLTHFISDKHVCVSFMAHACCFGKVATNYYNQTTDGSFHFPFHSTTRLFLWLYCSETFTRPSF